MIGYQSYDGQPDRTVREALTEFQYIIKGLSPHTQRSYMTRMEHFTCWCEEQQLLLGKIKPIHVAMYLDKLGEVSSWTGKPLSSYTLHGYMRVIRTFLFWCAEPLQGYVWIEVPRRLVMPRIEKVVIKPFSLEQIRALQRAITKNHFPILVARDKAILAVLLDTGIRANELCTLTLDRVYLTEREAYLLVLGKGLKQREVPLGKQARQLLEEYIKVYRPRQVETTCVFLADNHRSLTTSGLAQIFNRWQKRAKITGVRCSPHDCRHTYAINYLIQGGDVYMLSRLMGHASVSTTEMYLRAVKALQARTHSQSVLDHLFDEEHSDERKPEPVSQKLETYEVDGRSIEDTAEAYRQWTLFFAGWQERLGNAWVVASAVLEQLAERAPDMVEQGGQPGTRKQLLMFGAALRHRAGALYGKERFSVRWKPGPRGMNLWQVYQAKKK